ncbi:TonB-dependent receptor plug domain-containing protein [Bacteroidota bacterium]
MITTTAYSQEYADTTVKLDEVIIATTRLKDFSSGMKITTFDSIIIDKYRFSNTAELLSLSSSFFVKSYGNGSLATVSSRGTSAAHTGIFWNGININQPNIGLSDLSLIPVSLFESIELQHGGASSLFGSGNIGGSIQLKTSGMYQNELYSSVAGSYGSFGFYNSQAKLKYSSEKFFSKTGVFIGGADNDFEFRNYTKFDNPVEKQEHSRIKQQGFMQEFGKKIVNDQFINLSVWYHDVSREIPPYLTMAKSEAIQDDQSLRSILSYAKYYNKGSINLKSAYLINNTHYIDPSTEIDSRIYTESIITEIEGGKYIGENKKLQLGINATRNIAELDAYQEVEIQDQLALFLLYSHKFPVIKWEIAVNLRQELIDGYNVPFTPSFGSEGKIWKSIYARINISKNFRIPTLNDRYWIPGGNEDLLPESGWNEEIGLIFKFEKNKTFNNITNISFYNSVIDNWILWQPGNGFWRPKNIQKVWSRGLEASHLIKMERKGMTLSLSFNYAYSLATNEKKISETDLSYHKQLIYIPKHTGNIFTCFLFLSFEITYGHVFIGNTYMNTDNSKSLVPHDLGNLSIGKSLDLKRISFWIKAEVKNIWNSDYQTIQYMPMPGRAYYISLTMKLSK